MKIIYPYNETLPRRRAHDAYIMRTCASMASAGHDVTLLCGKGSLEKKELFQFYKIHPDNPLKVIQLPILRRKNLMRIQWNFLFFWRAQRYIEKHKPDCVICSVLKQADFHLSRRVKECLYLYEVHQLQWYPTLKAHMSLKQIRWERSIFDRCNLITVTTNALKNILTTYPYQVKVPIEKVPLACDFEALKPSGKLTAPLQLYYVGQLYKSQGLDRLLMALKEVEGVHLNVVGGKPGEIIDYQNLCQKEQLQHKVSFIGFYSSAQLKEVLKEADAFITTFENTERMPYVAHTKLYEYQAWKRPIIAPKLEVVCEHLLKGALFYETEQEESLVEALNQIQNPKIYQTLLDEAQEHVPFNWKKRGCLFNELLNKLRISQKK